MNANVVQVSEVDFSYEDTKDVLKRISLSVEHDESVGLIGPNGAGKTTLLLLVCGILEPDSGSLTVNGSPVRHGHFNPDVGYVFQSPDDQLFSPTVWDDVSFGPANMRCSREEVEARTRKALVECMCGHLAERPSHHLSGGEKRLAAIASVLSLQPRILLYDEPTSNLDVQAKRQLVGLLRTGSKANIIASHDLEFVLSTCERVYVLSSGEIAAHGSTEEIMGNKSVMERAGLEVPHSLR